MISVDDTKKAKIEGKKAQEWVVAELKWATEQIQGHEDGHSRAKATTAKLRKYRNDLKDYVTDGFVTGSKPTRPE